MLYDAVYPIDTKSNSGSNNPAQDANITSSNNTDDGGNFIITAIVSADAAAKFRVEQRRAGSALTSPAPARVWVAANDTQTIIFPATAIKGDSFRIAMDAALVGNAAGTLIVQRIAGRS